MSEGNIKYLVGIITGFFLGMGAIIWILVISGCTPADPSMEKRIEALEKRPSLQFQWKPQTHTNTWYKEPVTKGE